MRMKGKTNKPMTSHHRILPVVLLCIWILSGCGPALRTPQLTGTPQLFKPAPPIQETPTPNEDPQELARPLATPVCIDNLTFIADTTIPDGTAVQANSTLDKRWEVKNSGNCNWDERYRLRLIAGPGMDAQQEQALFPARSGAQVQIQIVFQAPEEPGSYRSAWQAYNPDGQPFGDPIFIDILVQ